MSPSCAELKKELLGRTQEYSDALDGSKQEGMAALYADDCLMLGMGGGIYKGKDGEVTKPPAYRIIDLSNVNFAEMFTGFAQFQKLIDDTGTVRMDMVESRY